jgi:hypothetical protein
MSEAFWIDRDYDAAQASDGVSRYGAYVRQHAAEFAEAWGESDAVSRFAESAWRAGTGPVMAPGYVRCHPRIKRARVQRSHWDGSLAAAVELVGLWSAALDSSRSWQGDRYWRDWPTEHQHWNNRDVFLEPSEEDITKAPYLLTTHDLRFAVPTGALPAPPAGPYDDLVDLARATVETLVAELNRIVAPVIAALENG